MKNVPRTGKRKRKPWFTLAELIVVVAILAVLAAVGFVALSWYARDASESRAKTNVRSVYSAITSESAVTGNSPRYYVTHDPNYGLSWAVVIFENANAPLVWGDWNVPGTNYSAGNPDFVKLKLNPEKFRVSSTFPEKFPAWFGEDSADAAANSKMPIVGAAEITWKGAKPRTVSYVQVAGIPESWVAFVVGNYPVNSSGSVSGLVKDPTVPSLTGAIVEGAAAWGPIACVTTTYGGYSVPGLSNGQTGTATMPIANGNSTLPATCTDGTFSYGTASYSCETGYTLSWTACYANCGTSSQTVNAHPYSVSAMNHGNSTVATSVVSISNGSQTYQQSFACDDGAVSTSGGENNVSNSCNTGYSWNGSSCVANSWSSGSWGTCSWETGTWSYTAWGTCSVTCWGGTQTRTASCTRNADGSQSRTVQCLRYDGTVLAWSNCLAAKPATSQSCTQWSDSVCGTVAATSQACNTQACAINGVCSASVNVCTSWAPTSQVTRYNCNDTFNCNWWACVWSAACGAGYPNSSTYTTSSWCSYYSVCWWDGTYDTGTRCQCKLYYYWTCAGSNGGTSANCTSWGYTW